VKYQCPRAILRENAVQHEGVDMDVQIERAPEPLEVGHCPPRGSRITKWSRGPVISYAHTALSSFPGHPTRAFVVAMRAITLRHVGSVSLLAADMDQ